jgi:hypothetical protein
MATADTTTHQNSKHCKTCRWWRPTGQYFGWCHKLTSLPENKHLVGVFSNWNDSCACYESPTTSTKE